MPERLSTNQVGTTISRQRMPFPQAKQCYGSSIIHQDCVRRQASCARKESGVIGATFFLSAGKVVSPGVTRLGRCQAGIRVCGNAVWMRTARYPGAQRQDARTVSPLESSIVGMRAGTALPSPALVMCAATNVVVGGNSALVASAAQVVKSAATNVAVRESNAAQEKGAARQAPRVVQEEGVARQAPHVVQKEGVARLTKRAAVPSVVQLLSRPV